MSNTAAAQSPTPVQQKPSSSSGGSSSSGSSSSSNVVQLKKSLAGHGYDAQAAMLSPGGAPVQMRSAVQREEGDGGVCMPDGTAQTNTTCEADPSASAPATSSGGGGGGEATQSGGGGGAGGHSGGGPEATHSGGGGGGAGGHSGGAGGHSGGAGGEHSEVYNDQSTVGQSTETVELPGHRGVSVGTANGGTIGAERTKSLPPLNYYVPVAAMPIFQFGMTGTLTASVGGSIAGLTAGQTEVEAGGSVVGSLQARFTLGAAPEAYAYIGGGPEVRANAQIKLDAEGIKEVKLDLTLDMTANVGVQVGEEFNFNHQLGRLNIGRMVGFEYKRGEPIHTGQFQPGAALLEAMREAKAARDTAMRYAHAAADTARAAGRTISRAWNWLTT